MSSAGEAIHGLGTESKAIEDYYQVRHFPALRSLHYTLSTVALSQHLPIALDVTLD
eukprot:COSAG02_NODE_103_length_36570_cov_25.164487_9_plen_56_part_00